jgi:two-component system nitrate/nitrite response regulator NarL
MANNCGSILISDGDKGFRSLVSGLFEQAGFRTTQASNGHDALSEARRKRPALAVLDVHLSGLSGYEVCHELKLQYGDALPVVFVSDTRTEALDRIAGLLIGADDYIAKPLDSNELLVRARRLIERSHNPARAGNGDAHAGDVPPMSALALTLTPREREVLGLLGAGLRQAAIADRLVLSPKTVSTHIQRILTKLGVHSRAQAVALAHREGLVAEADVEAHAAIAAVA